MVSLLMQLLRSRHNSPVFPSLPHARSSAKKTIAAMRRAARNSLLPAIAVFGWGSICPPDTLAGCGCNDQSEASCSTCDSCATAPRMCGLGNGILDYLNKASGHVEASFFRLRANKGGCRSNCDATCDSYASSSDFATMAGDSFESDEPLMQRGISPTHHPSLPPSHNSDSPGSFDASPVPVPIPDPIASPPSNHPVERRPGNPFTDEARLSPKKEFIAPIRTTIPARSASNYDFSLASVDVKPVPKHLLRGRSAEKVLDVHVDDGQIDHTHGQVITAGSLQPTAARKAQFAR